MTMQDSVFATLSKYDSYFYTATSADFIRGLTKNEIKELTDAAKEVGILYTHNGCPKCCLDFIKKLAVPYYKEKERRAIEAAKVKEEQKEAQKPKQPKQKGKNYERTGKELEPQSNEGRKDSTNEA